MRPHPFHPGDHRTHDGRRICEFCGSAEGGKVHQVAPVPDEVRRAEARRVGEGE